MWAAGWRVASGEWRAAVGGAKLYDPRPTTHDPRPTTHDPRPTTHDPRPTIQGVLNEQEQLRLLADLEQALAFAQQGLPPYNEAYDGTVNYTYQHPPATKFQLGRQTLQYGCAYESRNTAKCKHGIKTDRYVAPMPACLTNLLLAMHDKGIVTEETRPDSAVVDIFNEGDCMVRYARAHTHARTPHTLTAVLRLHASTSRLAFAPHLPPFTPHLRTSPSPLTFRPSRLNFTPRLRPSPSALHASPPHLTFHPQSPPPT